MKKLTPVSLFSNIFVKNLHLFLFCLGALVAFGACGKRKTFEKYNNIPALTWVQSNVSKYAVNITEFPAETPKMGIGLRVVPSIAHKSVPVSLTIKPKNEKLAPFTKNFQIVIKDENDKIKGGVMGDLADIEQALEDFPFKEKGEYEVEIKHLNSTTQDQKILGIMEVGFFVN